MAVMKISEPAIFAMSHKTSSYEGLKKAVSNYESSITSFRASSTQSKKGSETLLCEQ